MAEKFFYRKPPVLFAENKVQKQYGNKKMKFFSICNFLSDSILCFIIVFINDIIVKIVFVNCKSVVILHR